MEKSQAPINHLGFIVDCNRRWARAKNLPTIEGHRRGLKKVEKIIDAVAKRKIPFTSFYLFSTENWNREEKEVTYLMNLLRKNLPRLTEKMQKNNLKCLILGSDERVAPDLLAQLKSAESSTASCTGGAICFCFNYGGHQEIADAAQKITRENGDFSPENFTKHLYHPEVPPLDLIVRTSGEERISGFMLWRAAYAEFLFLEKFWPDIEPGDLDSILAEFSSRSRRFGK